MQSQIAAKNSPNKQSGRQQIEMILSRCHQLHREKQQSEALIQSEQLSNVDQPLKQQIKRIVVEKHERDDFDRIMEEDLENQLNELELKHIEQKQQQNQYETLLKQMKRYAHLDLIESTMQSSNKQMILMSFNETGSIQYSIPIGHDLTYRMFTNNTIILRILKQRIDTLNKTFLRHIHLSPSTLAQDDCNNTIFDRYFIFIIVGLLLLILLNIIVIIRQICFKSSSIRNETKSNQNSNETRHTQYRPETHLSYVKWHILRSSLNYTGPFLTSSSSSSILIDNEYKSMIEESYAIILLLIQLLLALILMNITIISWKKYANYQKHYKRIEHQQLRSDKETQGEPYYYEIVDIV
ncbi:unnamed protein product [Rotaria sordida]|uniref:Uncharacterized protein n=3 Tax=Rotaria TaxID=231623 RepID=A0A819X6X9_9BILA|nr:unnamed protein product [Rotaria sordida]